QAWYWVSTPTPPRVGFGGLNAAARPQRGGFQVLATRGDPSFGGADIDQALLEHVGSLVSSADPAAWRQLVEGRELADRRRRRVLRQDVRGAKETLSRHAYTDVPMPPPFADAHVTREDLERLIGAPLGRAVELTSAAIADAGLRPKQLTAIFLVGGSSRIPMISRLTHERTGVVPTSLDQPETVVARGALRAVLVDPDRTGSLPGTTMARLGAMPGGVPPAEHRTEVVRPGDVPRPAASPPAAPPAPRTGDPRATPPRPTEPHPSFPPRPAPSAFSPLNAARQGPPASPPRGQAAVPWGSSAPEQGGDTKRVGRAGRSKRSKLLWIVAAVVVVALGATGLVVMLNQGGADKPPGRPLAQYDYRFIAPPDWVQTDDRVAEKQVVIHPQDSPAGFDLVVAQEYPMNYDATADRRQLVDDLRGQAARYPERYSAYDPNASYAGRQVIAYQETKDQARVFWYVVVQGRIRVHIGCQYSVPALQQRVSAACQQVARTLEVVN
ncbi:type VII secretion-associated protein, partial [Amycolatopsis sp. NPDC059021]|uniref:type VII secretion-associated protein n=1 Tax=Amycolatopsis sp. NPDC059021 TaxID=3346704 RepID=UPI0036717D64